MSDSAFTEYYCTIEKQATVAFINFLCSQNLKYLILVQDKEGLVLSFLKQEFCAISSWCQLFQEFFWQFWEGALGPFRLGKLVR